MTCASDPTPAAAYRAVMFDLDGTLADTLRDLSEAGNAMCAAFDRPPQPMDRYRHLVGQGAPWLAQHTLDLPDGDPRIPAAADYFRKILLAGGHAHSEPYPQIPALLDELARRDLTLAVLSNKPHDLTVDLVRRLFGETRFARVRGHRDGTAPKPDPAAGLEIARELGIAPAQWIFVGDTRVDMLTGRNQGMRAVGVTWGFRAEQELRDSGAHHIIHEPMALLQALDTHAGLVT
ncbi:MAG: HAD family hydrolase [Phycisphaeraceae bacterium]